MIGMETGQGERGAGSAGHASIDQPLDASNNAAGCEANGAGAVGHMMHIIETETVQAERGAAAAGSTKHASIYQPVVASAKHIILDSFYQNRAVLRTVDRVTKTVYASQSADVQKPLCLRVLLNLLKDRDTSDEEAERLARKYIHQTIFTANVESSIRLSSEVY